MIRTQEGYIEQISLQALRIETKRTRTV